MQLYIFAKCLIHVDYYKKNTTESGAYTIEISGAWNPETGASVVGF